MTSNERRAAALQAALTYHATRKPSATAGYLRVDTGGPTLREILTTAELFSDYIATGHYERS